MVFFFQGENGGVILASMLDQVMDNAVDLWMH
jgi:hypothetical protein